MLSRTQIDDIIARYQSGKSVYVVARELSLPPTTVYNCLRKCGIPRRPRGKLTAALRAEIIERHRAGETMQALADRFGVTGSAIHMVVHKRKTNADYLEAAS